MKVGRLAGINNPALADLAKNRSAHWPFAFIIFASMLMAFPAGATATEWSAPQRIATQSPFEEPARLTGVSCPSDSFCAATDSYGNVVTSTEPMAGAPAWSLTSAKPTDTANGFTDISCTSGSFCAAVDMDGSVWTSTDPTGGPESWSYVHIEGEVEEWTGARAVSCPSINLCIAVSGNELAVSTEPTTGAWSVFQLTNAEFGISSISCPSTSFCAATDGDGNVHTSTNPAGGAGAWTSTSISGSGLSYISCSSNTLCVAGSSFATLYASTDPTGGSGTWNSASVGLATVSCPSSTLCVGARNAEVVTATDPTGGTGAWSPASVDTGSGFGITAVSCTSNAHCVSIREGKVFSSTDPTGGSAAWSAAQVDSFGASRLRGLSCPSTSLCAAVDVKRHVITSTNPTTGAATWNSDHIEPAEFSGGGFTAISCPSTIFCAIASNKEVVTSTNPTGGSGSWNAVSLASGTSGLSDISCPSASLCVAVDHGGRVLTSTNPTGEASAWQSVTVDAGTDFQAVSCPSSALCVAIDNAGNAWHSTNPTGGAAAWTATLVSAGTEFHDVSCLSNLCVAVGSSPTFNTFTVATTTEPTGSSGAWSVYPVSGIGGYVVSCPSTNLCLAGGYAGLEGYVAASSNPTKGASSWAATNPDPEFYGDHYITAVACVSDSLCLIGDKLGRVAFGTPKTGSGGEEGGGEEPGPIHTCSTDPSLCPSSGQPSTEANKVPESPKTVRAVGVADGVAVVSGSFALLPSRCVGPVRCKGLAKLVVKMGSRNSKRQAKRAAHAARRHRKGKALLVVGKGRFNIAPGKRGVIRIKLTGAGKQAVHKAGKHGLRARLLGTGLKVRTVTLKPKTSRRKRARSARGYSGAESRR